jgi:hypothetical protein
MQKIQILFLKFLFPTYFLNGPDYLETIIWEKNLRVFSISLNDYALWTMRENFCSPPLRYSLIRLYFPLFLIIY